MNLLLNGQAIEVETVSNLQAFLLQQENLPEQYAIAVNGAFVAQGLYADTAIQDGDDIELLVPMQGG